MSRIFKTRHFSRWMRKTELSDAALCKAVIEMEKGLIDADHWRIHPQKAGSLTR